MRRIAIFGLAALAWSAEAGANDGNFGGSGASLAPLASTPVKMLREDITLELAGRPLAWRVTAAYEFENPTGAPVTVQMGYPETRCDPEEGDCMGQGGRFRGLDTKVRGRPVRHRVGRVAESSPWAMELARVYLFDVTFAARERVRIEHRYTYDRSFTAVLGENVHYLTRTGTLWSGPIGEARFVVRTPNPPLVVEHPRSVPLTSWDRVVQGGRGVTELVFVARDYRPTEDFGVLLGEPARLQAGEPIGDGSVDVTGCVAALTAGRSREGRRAAEEYLRESTAEELTGCQNLVLALSGSPMPDARWTRALYGGQGRTSGMGDGWVVETLRAARTFAPAQMPTTHAAFLRRIRAALAGPARTRR